MKFLFAFGLFFSIGTILSDCSESKFATAKNAMADNVGKETDFPASIRIEFGPYGKGYGSHQRTLQITNNEVKCLIRNPDPKISDREYSVPLDSTQFKHILADFTSADFEGSKSYSDFGTKDGGYFKVTTSDGERMFVNVFSANGIRKNIRPDTIGLHRYERLWNEARIHIQK